MKRITIGVLLVALHLGMASTATAVTAKEAREIAKEAYLFNYNGEPHGLRKTQNKKDWARRMAEFFDHHLRGKPAPKWMQEGVRYADREREKIQYAPSYIDGQKRKAGAANAASGATTGATTGSSNHAPGGNR